VKFMRMGIVYFIFIQLYLCLLAATVHASESVADEFVGKWVMPDGAALLEIIPVSNEERSIISSSHRKLPQRVAIYQIRLLALRDPEFTSADGDVPIGKMRTDIHNPEKALRQHPLQGMILGDGFYQQDDALVGGKIYDPGSGNIYRAELKPTADGMLEVRGFLGISLFGRTMHWHRAEPFFARVTAMFSSEFEAILIQ